MAARLEKLVTAVAWMLKKIISRISWIKGLERFSFVNGSKVIKWIS